MAGKTVKWTSRRKRRATASQKKRKFFYWILAAAVAIIVWQLFAVNLPGYEGTLPASGFAPVQREAGEDLSADSSWSRLLQRMLADNIPGMAQPVLAENEELRGAVLDAFHSLTGVDPRDPRSILERELGAGVLISLPVLHPPDGLQPDGNEDNESPVRPEEPEVQIPVFNPVFPFLGYSEPVALVYHTHITETFVPTTGIRFSENLDRTVAILGKELVTLLQDQYGLPLLHHRGIYDLPRTPAYEKARPVIQELLAANPQLEMVIDLHRDGVLRGISTTTLNGVEVGKILIVIGTRHPGWESNLSFALRLQHELETVAPGLSRGIRRQNYGYNQDLHPNSILIEVGGHENTLEEASRAIPYLGEALARTYYVFFVQD